MITGSETLRAAAPTSKKSLAKDSRHHLFDPTQERGEWYGPMAEFLKLPKFIVQAVFQFLAEGFSPDGNEKLVQNAGDPNRQALIPFVFSVPKMLSVFLALASAEIRAQGCACIMAAAKTAVDYFQEVAGFARQGEREGVTERAGLLWAFFLQYASQANDPHFHIHAYLFNNCVKADGTFGTIRSIDFYNAIRSASAIFEADLAARIGQTFGLTVIPVDKGGFEIKGVPKELCEKFSSRHAQIDASLKAHHGNSAEAGRVAALSTRGDKEILSQKALLGRWQRKGCDSGFGEEQIKKLINSEKVMDQRHGSFQESFRIASQNAQPGKEGRRKLIERGRKLAITHRASGNDLKQEFEKHIPNKLRFIRIESRQLFPKAAFYNPARLLTAPRIVIGNRPPFRRWGDVHFQKDTILGRVRVQDRILASQAPRWSPFYKLTIPALRIGKMRVTENELWGNTKATMKIGGGEARIQFRRVFPRALKWNPLKHVKIPVPRFIAPKAAQPKFGKFKNTHHERNY